MMQQKKRPCNRIMGSNHVVYLVLWLTNWISLIGFCICIVGCGVYGCVCVFMRRFSWRHKRTRSVTLHTLFAISIFSNLIFIASEFCVNVSDFWAHFELWLRQLLKCRQSLFGCCAEHARSQFNFVGMTFQCIGLDT